MKEDQFDPQTQSDQALTEIESKLLEVTAAVERLRWLKGKTDDDARALRERAERFETFTDADAAAMFHVENVETFAALRRKYNFPHVKIGQQVCYTRRQLDMIADIMTINNKPFAMRKAA